MDGRTCLCVCPCVSMCVCLWLWTQTFPGGKHGCSLLFLLLFQITVCFINAMVNLLSPPSLVPLLCETEESSKDTHWSKRLLRPHATQLVSTVSIFYECFCSKVVVGELRIDNMPMTKRWKHYGANGGMTGPSGWLHCQLVFLLHTVYGAVLHLNGWCVCQTCWRGRKTERKNRVNIWSLGAHLIFLSINFSKFFLLVNRTLFFSHAVTLQLIILWKMDEQFNLQTILLHQYWSDCACACAVYHHAQMHTRRNEGVHVGAGTSCARTHTYTDLILS